MVLAVPHASAQDSLRFFTFSDFEELVLKNHPVAQQAALLPEIARAELLETRGAFDPKLASYFSQKEFKDDVYYNRWNTYLTIPTWWGVDLKAGYERNSGSKLLPEESPRLAYAGIAVPIAQGLLIDARRATLQQAQLARQVAEAERVKLINKVLYDAAKTYWDWYFSYQQFRLMDEGLQLADVRYQAISRRVRLGDAAPIDSIEARITLQDRLVQRQQAQLEAQNARLGLSNFLWDANANPVELPSQAQPGPVAFRTIADSTLQALLAQARSSHPELVKLDYKLRQLDIENRFRRNQLLPQVSVNFNFLSDPIYVRENSMANAFMVNNHKLGADLVFPLFQRKERGKLQQIRLKQVQTRFDQQQVGREVTNGVQQAYNEVKSLEGQMNAQEQAVRDQDLLLRAERQKFEMGESSLFLVNTRESKYLDLRVKLESLRAKYEKALAGLGYAAGTRDW